VAFGATAAPLSGRLFREVVLMAKKTPKKKLRKSAVTGEFVTKTELKKNPKETFEETVKPAPKKAVKKAPKKAPKKK
jgi:hypothetical protein